MKVTNVFLRTENNYDRDAASIAAGLKCMDETRTKQSFKEECDINTIMRKFNVTGQLPQNVHAPTYEDFSDVTDFHTAMNAIVAANESFDKMPAETRYRFNNDPQRFVEFCSDGGNRAEMIKMGLIPPPPAENAGNPQGDTNKQEKVSPRPVTTRGELVEPEKPAGKGS